MTRRGLVNPNDLSLSLSLSLSVSLSLSLSLSEKVLACDIIGYGIYQTLIGLNSDLYLIGYYNGASTTGMALVYDY
jgi:hypothetical protein